MRTPTCERGFNVYLHRLGEFNDRTCNETVEIMSAILFYFFK